MELLGYVLNEPLYYTFFAFFIFFIGIKDQEKRNKYEKGDEIDLYKISMWLTSAALIISGIVLIIWKTIDDTSHCGLIKHSHTQYELFPVNRDGKTCKR